MKSEIIGAYCKTPPLPMGFVLFFINERVIIICRGDRPVAPTGNVILHLTTRGPVRKNPSAGDRLRDFVQTRLSGYFSSFNVFESSSDGKANSLGSSA